MHCHCGTNNRAPRWTFTDPSKPEVRPRAWEDSASPARLAASWISALKQLNGIHQTLTGSTISTFSSKLVFFGPIRKTRWPPWPLVGKDIQLLLWNCWTVFNETWQEARSERTLPSLCFLFEPIGRIRWPPWPVIGLYIFRLLIWINSTEFNKTSQEAKSRCPLPSLCFSGRSENKMSGLPSDWLAHVRLILWNRKWNSTKLTGSKIAKYWGAPYLSRWVSCFSKC